MKCEAFLAVISKVATAVGDNDLIKISFLSQGEKHLCSLVAYDGKTMQFQSVMGYEGDAEKDGAYIVKASALIKTLSLYKELGVESITIEPAENTIVLKDGNGNITLPVVDKMVTLDEKTLNADVKGMFVAPLKTVQDALKIAGISIAKDGALNGVYFALDSEAKQFTIYASDGYIGTRNTFTAEVNVTAGGSAADMSFFAMPAVVKAIAALKGDALSAIVTGQYLILKDQENTLAVIKLNRSKFPLTMMEKTFVKLSEAGDAVEYSTVTLPAATLVAATELCTLAASDKEKVVKLNYADDKFAVSEKADKSARNIADAKVKVVNPAVLSKNYLVEIVRRTLKAVPTDKVTVKFTSKCDMLYADGAEYPVAFMLPRK